MKETDRQKQMFALVEECHHGILTRKQFCEQHSISMQCFFYWQKKYRKTAQSTDIPAGFVQIGTGNRGNTGSLTVQPLVVTYPNGVSLQLPLGIPLAVIASLLRLA